MHTCVNSVRGKEGSLTRKSREINLNATCKLLCTHNSYSKPKRKAGTSAKLHTRQVFLRECVQLSMLVTCCRYTLTVPTCEKDKR